VSGDETVLDMGCGSGILAIGAMLLGAGSVLAVDIEENSTKTALENAQKNYIDMKMFKTLTGNIINNQKLKDKIGYNKYDIIVANIVADVIIMMASDFKNFIKKDGILIVSGIIAERVHEVKQALNISGFKA
jgi:ribosomal protein L11 methyltransferase